MDADTSIGPFFNGERIRNHRTGTPRETAEVQMIGHGGKASTCHENKGSGTSRIPQVPQNQCRTHKARDEVVDGTSLEWDH